MSRARPPARGAKGARSKSAPAPRAMDLVIDHLGARGDGVARCDLGAVYIPFTVPGDTVQARIDGRRGDGLSAAIVDLVSPGPARVAPPCPLFGRCGGCSLQHVAPDTYAAWKRGLLVQALDRARLGEVAVDPLVAVAPGSRRRAAFAFFRRKASTCLGFNARASHTVVDVSACLLLAPPVQSLLEPMRALLTRLVADGESGDVVATLTDAGLDVVVEAEARLDLFDREVLASFAEAQDLARLSWRRPGGGGIEPIARRRAALVRFAGVAVEPPPGNFLQPTQDGETAIATAVLAAIATAAPGPVADLFCGCGSFALPLAAGHRVVHAVEGDDAPIQALDQAARQAGLRVTTETRDLARRPLLPHELARFAAIVFDPPRTGALAQAEQLAAGGPPLVVAVSCNPATLARDLAVLVAGGYRIERVIPIDQFPHSAHLEAVAVLRR